MNYSGKTNTHTKITNNIKNLKNLKEKHITIVDFVMNIKIVHLELIKMMLKSYHGELRLFSNENIRLIGLKSFTLILTSIPI